ncbi:hypothetical protein [Aquimarina litoralis]|uniref:hypothetical protein n=1 Tax=Aquimarina litoralis TaxID=584605 RepID=UPI001C580E71|nr:hypothetical protein [Aquimarina litoralis]MBW1295749.1 hypothetical protein [Aquimarina litoralis]
MKKTYLFAMASLFFAAVSCSDDDSNNGPGVVTVTPDPTEEVALNPDDVSSGIIIQNGTQITGNAPSPTGTLPFSLDKTTLSGFQKNGFDITFNAPTNYAGSYIQVQSSDGTMADEYWDIVQPTKSHKKQNRLFGKSKNNSKSNDQEINIDVDFEDTVSPGTFCYLICIYDTDGNISQPVEVCVEVEAWGGNPNLVGTWNLTKEEITYDGETDTDIVGQETCESFTVNCNNDTELTIDDAYCYTINLAKVTFNADGTLSETFDESSRNFDYSATVENCQAAYGDVEEYNYAATGYWAYDEEESSLTLVIFNETTNGDPATYENGDAYSVTLEEVTGTTFIVNDPGEEAIKSFFTRE